MSPEPSVPAGARPAAPRSGRAWGSALTADEFAAIRGAGFEPVGQAFGAAVYGTGPTVGSVCPGARGRPDSPDGETAPPQPVTQVSGPDGTGAFGPLAQAMDQARRTAIGAMIAECAQLGGDGVVGVRVSRGTFALGGQQFTVIGTAVRAAGASPGAVPGVGPGVGPGAAPGPPVPFTSAVCGQDFAKLIRAGWVPVGLVLGVAIGARHDDRDTARQTRWSAGNTEVAGWTDLVGQARHDARRQLERDVERLGGEGAVLAAMRLQVRQRDCPAAVGRHDHIAEATLLGSAIARFSAARPHPGGPALTIMSLDPQRRRAARIRF